jgi:radical SAM/Cys-rich protein
MTSLPAPERSDASAFAGEWPSFRRTLRRRGCRLSRGRLTILQVNLGLLCNQACHHCHLEAGPSRTEVMGRDTLERIVSLLAGAGGRGIETVDITGGAPELNPGFRDLVTACRRLGKRVIDRCNLTVLLEPGQEDTPEFLAEQRVEIVASLPCYTRENVEKQRGKGVFEASVGALRRLNGLGYGRRGSGLTLDLVYNPLGPSLPPPQEALEADYKRVLSDELGIVFNRLLTITNMPIHRFRRNLERSDRLGPYMRLLHDRFNEETLGGLMCRELVSVSWDGRLFDCDFNQALGIPLAHPRRTVWELEDLSELDGGAIRIGNHCYGCTAGAGSSCRGAVC